MSFDCNSYLKEFKRYQKKTEKLKEKKDYPEDLIDLINPLNDLKIEKLFLLGRLRKLKLLLQLYPLTEKEKNYFRKQKKLISEKLERIDLVLNSVSKQNVN
jgi:hypothetical protein